MWILNEGDDELEIWTVEIEINFELMRKGLLLGSDPRFCNDKVFFELFDLRV